MHGWFAIQTNVWKVQNFRISIQTLLFQACLPTRRNGVENRDKTYYNKNNASIENNNSNNRELMKIINTIFK